MLLHGSHIVLEKQKALENSCCFTIRLKGKSSLESKCYNKGMGYSETLILLVHSREFYVAHPAGPQVGYRYLEMVVIHFQARQVTNGTVEKP